MTTAARLVERRSHRAESKGPRGSCGFDRVLRPAPNNKSRVDADEMHSDDVEAVSNLNSF